MEIYQNLASYPIGVIVLRTKRIRLPDLLPLVTDLRVAIEQVKAGEPCVIDGRAPQ